jgi:hypothetical protein
VLTRQLVWNAVVRSITEWRREELAASRDVPYGHVPHFELLERLLAELPADAGEYPDLTPAQRLAGLLATAKEAEYYASTGTCPTCGEGVDAGRCPKCGARLEPD